MDIDVLIDYIQRRGFAVRVYTGTLVICKYAGEEQCSVNWGIVREDLARLRDKEVLFWRADTYMAAIDAAIKQREEEERNNARSVRTASTAH